MKTRWRHIILIITIAAITLGVPAFTVADDSAADETAVQNYLPAMNENETALFTLINAARRDPLGMAESLGMNRDEILNSLPELNDILINGLPEFSFSEALYRSATDHNRDMLDQNYYAYASIDGKTPEQRMMEAGYAPAAAGEALGMMFFNNFIDPDVAVSRIFENIFKDELSPERDIPRCILSPDFEDIGLGIGGGIYQLDDFKSNIYLLVCDFGTLVKPYEMQLLTLVNQLRSQPAAVTRSFGVDVQEVLDLFPKYAAFYADGQPPLISSSRLYAAANIQVADMLENNYWGHISPEGITPLMRIQAQGYAPTWIAESKYRLSTCNRVLSPANTIPVIFRNMFFNAFKNGTYRDSNMLSEKAREVGMRVVAAESKILSSICGDQVHIGVCDYAASQKTVVGDDYSAKQALTGVVYADLNENGLYDAGEGLADVAITVQRQGTDDPSAKSIFTGETGGYTIFLEPGRYRVSVVCGASEDLQARIVEINAANVWLPFLVEEFESGQ